MANTSDLLNFRLFEDQDGVHLLLSGRLAQDLQTLLDTCSKFCNCCVNICPCQKKE